MLISTILVASAGVQAQTSADFSVMGTVTPPSCTLTVTGAVDYATLSAGTVKSAPIGGVTPHRSLGQRAVNWSLACEAPMPVELVFDDNKLGKAAPYDTATTAVASRYGLVDKNGASVGSYTLALPSASATTVDGAAAYGYLYSTKASTAWGSILTTGIGTTPGMAYGFVKAAGQTAPSWVTTASGTLNLNVYVRRSVLDAAKDAVAVSGAATITLQYL